MEETPTAVATGLNVIYKNLNYRADHAAPVKQSTKPLYAAPTSKADARIQALFPQDVLAFVQTELTAWIELRNIRLNSAEKTVLTRYRQRMRSRVFANRRRAKRASKTADVTREIERLEVENAELRQRIAFLERN